MLAPSHEIFLLEEIISVPSLSHRPSAANYFTVDLAILKELLQ
ncbi:MAG: hypothetical protein NVSMB49_28630 [Ktedonobacteraceae bacterium]